MGAALYDNDKTMEKVPIQAQLLNGHINGLGGCCTSIEVAQQNVMQLVTDVPQ